MYRMLDSVWPAHKWNFLESENSYKEQGSKRRPPSVSAALNPLFVLGIFGNSVNFHCRDSSVAHR